MKEIIVDIKDESYLLENYSNSKVNRLLLEYIINAVWYTKMDEKFVIKINNYINGDLNIQTLIKESFSAEIEKLNNERRRNNLLQICLLVIGIIFLVLSQIVAIDFIFSELFIIIGWVPIWEAIDIELFKDSKNKRKRIIIKKILDSEIIVIDKRSN